MRFFWLALCALGTVASPPENPADTEPLVMENADHMQGLRLQGEYILTGHVRFRHGNLRLETERAVWQRDANKVECEAALRITQGTAVLTADLGSYDKATNRAVAQGQVFFRDTADSMEGQGNRLTYDRLTHEAVLTGDPLVRRIYPPDTSAKDSARGRGPDTLLIRGRVLHSNDSTRISLAEGDVVITRQDMRITCARAEYRQRDDSLFITGQPRIRVAESDVQGLSMRLGLAGETLRGLFVAGDAQAQSREPATDSTAARQSQVDGDSLFMAFHRGAVESVQVFRQAVGTYFDVNRPAYVNRMNGEYMVLRFRQKQVHDAEVVGGAHSTYYHFEKDTLQGENKAVGDTIAFDFRNGKVDQVLIHGHARGVYQGQSLGGSSRHDTASALRKGKS